MATLDATTAAEYAAEVYAVDRAQVVVDALADPVSVKIYNTVDDVVASGTMTTPWATANSNQVIPTTLSGLFATTSAELDVDWYLRFESGSRYVECSFGFAGSGKEATWSLSEFEIGTQAGISPSAITVTGETLEETTAWPTQTETYLRAIRNRNGFATSTRHAFTGGVPTLYRVNTTTYATAQSAVGDGSYRGGLGPALAASGNRIIVFETSGSINLGNQARYVTNGNLWIAGQTAPSPGVTLYNGGLTFQCSNVLMQHMRIHNTGTYTSPPGDAAQVDGSTARSNIVFDHCEFAYARDELVDLYRNVASFDLIECLLTWPLLTTGAIGSGMLARGNTAGNSLSIQGCYFAHNQQRNPFTTSQNVLVANSIFYDYGDMALAKESASIPTYTNVIGNRMKSSLYGPISLYSTATSGTVGYGNTSSSSTAYDGSTKLWCSGNTLNGTLVASQATLPSGWVDNGCSVSAVNLAASAQLSAAIPTGWVGWTNGSDMESYILANAGARPANRNTCATQSIADYTSLATGRISTPNYPDTALAVNAATFNWNALGPAFSDNSEGYGGTYRKNVEVYLLNLGEAA